MRRRQKIKRKGHLSRHKTSRKFRNYLSGFALLIFITTFAVPVIAEEAEGPGEKLAEGVKETATGWVEVPKEIAETSEETTPVEGITVGTVKGAGEAVVKTAEGAVKAATFYIPEKEKEEE